MLKSAKDWRSDIYEAFAAAATLRHYPRKSVVYAQGEPAQAAYAVKSGMVELTGLSETGHDIAYSIRRAGDTFGYAEVVLREPRTRGAVVLDDSDIWVLAQDRFLDLLSSRPDIVLALLGSALDRGNRQAEMRAALRGRPARNRVAWVLSSLSGWPIEAAPGRDPRSLRITHEDISRLCELSRQTVTTILDEFQQLGLVNLGFGRLLILDPVALRQIAESS